MSSGVWRVPVYDLRLNKRYYVTAKNKTEAQENVRALPGVVNVGRADQLHVREVDYYRDVLDTEKTLDWREDNDRWMRYFNERPRHKRPAMQKPEPEEGSEFIDLAPQRPPERW